MLKTYGNLMKMISGSFMFGWEVIHHMVTQTTILLFKMDRSLWF